MMSGPNFSGTYTAETASLPSGTPGDAFVVRGVSQSEATRLMIDWPPAATRALCEPLWMIASLGMPTLPSATM